VEDKIFDQFFTTKEVGRGTGQGLALARAIVVNKHCGQLTFTSRAGSGTTFFVSLPVADVDRAAESRPA
jgi:signal transduction histidine kinase